MSCTVFAVCLLYMDLLYKGVQRIFWISTVFSYTGKVLSHIELTVLYLKMYLWKVSYSCFLYLSSLTSFTFKVKEYYSFLRILEILSVYFYRESILSSNQAPYCFYIVAFLF